MSQPAPTTAAEALGDVLHVAFTVRDLDASVAFYTRLGFREAMRWREGPEVCGTGLGLPDASIRLVHLNGHGVVLELMQYDAPPAALEAPSPADVGAAHLALQVRDIHAAARAVEAAGGRLVSAPQSDPSADWVQALDPDGIRVELLALSPDGTPPPGAILSDAGDAVDEFSAHRRDTTPGLSRLAGGATALLVIDMLNDFLEPGGKMVLPGGERLYEPINRLAGALRDAGGRVVWVCDRHDSLDDAEFRKRDPHCLAGTWGADVVNALDRRPGDHESVKRRYSAFFETDLDLWLRERGVTDLVLCGVVTNICVRSTAHDAFFRGYRVVVATDACAATGEREQASSLYDIDTHYGELATAAEVCAAVAAA